MERNRPNNRPNNKFKTEETIQRIVERKRTVAPLNREVTVFVEKIRPVYEGPDGEKRGPPRVKVVLSRGKGFVALTSAEAEVMAEMITEVIEPAQEAEVVCASEKEAWIKREDEKHRYTPGPGVGVLTPGKTERTKAKRKAKLESESGAPTTTKPPKKHKESKQSRKEKREEKGGRRK